MVINYTGSPMEYSQLSALYMSVIHVRGSYEKFNVTEILDVIIILSTLIIVISFIQQQVIVSR